MVWALILALFLFSPNVAYAEEVLEVGEVEEVIEVPAPESEPVDDVEQPEPVEPVEVLEEPVVEPVEVEEEPLNPEPVPEVVQELPEPVVVASEPENVYSYDGTLLTTTVEPEPVRAPAATSTPYASVSANTYSDLAASMLWKVGFGDDYVFWRGGQYQYCFAYGDLELSDSRFRGSGCKLVTFTLNSSYNGTYTMDVTTGSVDLSAGSYIVFSNLGPYPVLSSEFVGQYLVVWSLLVALVLYLVRSLFAFVLRVGVRNVS